MTRSGVPPNAQVPEVADALGHALDLLQLTGTLYCSAELSSPWGVQVPELEGAMTFQLVTAGECWLEVAGGEPQLLREGTLTVLPHGAPHCFRSQPRAALTGLNDLPVERLNERFEVLRHGGGGTATRVLYGVARFEPLAGRRLLATLPTALHIDTWSEATSGWLQSTARFIAQEAMELRPGAETVITRLADILLIQALRVWLECAPMVSQGWMAALRDPQVGRALTALHAAPEQGWSVASLASKAGMSRSVFAARFNELLGEAPMRYLASVRLQMAHAQLRRSSEPLSVLAERFGYQSEAAFGRAFRRAFGVSPGSVRRTPTQV